MAVPSQGRDRAEKQGSNTSFTLCVVPLGLTPIVICTLLTLAVGAAGSDEPLIPGTGRSAAVGSAGRRLSEGSGGAGGFASAFRHGPPPPPPPAGSGHGHASRVIYTQPMVPSDVVSSCAAFIDYYGEIAANFTNCVIHYARPLRVCENCVDEYAQANAVYQMVMKGQHEDKHGVLCGNMILNSDRIQVIVRSALFIDKLWEDCSCASCFDVTTDQNGTVRYRLSNDTINFHRLAFQTAQCFENSSQIIPSGNKTQTNTSEVCDKCGDTYRRLNDLYNHMEEQRKHHLCMDIVDAMNSTRLQWSKSYGCSAKQVDAMPVFVLSGIFCLLPIVFYVGNRLHSTKVQKTIMKQRRVRDTTSPDAQTPEISPGNDDSS